MCGIAGSYSIDKLDTAALKGATDVLLHRGPDAGGYYTDDSGKVFLGHRRLSILDLSTVANQPMYSADGRYVIIYNGEVYNFTTLRDKLPGHNWRTHGDTEVILELFAAYGAESFSWLNGIFAIAIYDIQEGKLYICRDQLGIKPIFYYWDQRTLVFASELKVINAYFKHVSKKALQVNREAIPYFLHMGFIPEPHTIYQQVYKFPAGNYAMVDTHTGNMQMNAYWRAQNYYLYNTIRNEGEATAQYKQKLFDAVQSQMVSDVPLGTFLSGGIDSSLVTAVASKVAAHRVKTFSIGFNEARYDESEYAEAVAKHLGTDHHTFKVSVNDVLELVPSLLDVYDEPYGDSSAFPTMLVSQLARQHVTVTLSGDGGDELFQGYGMYTWANRLNKPVVKTLRKPLYALTQMMGNKYKRGGGLFNYPSAARLHTHIFSQEQYFFSEQELSKLLLNNDFDFSGINDLGVGTKGSAAERQALWDVNNYLKDDLLVKVDRASMRYSLECRVPLLDINLVQFALNLDYKLKVREGYGTKYLMKKTLYEMVPRELFERPKRGFAIPLKEWLRGPLQYLVHDYLNDTIVQEQGIVSVEAVRTLLKRFNAGEDYLYNRIWLLIVLHLWLKKYK